MRRIIKFLLIIITIIVIILCYARYIATNGLITKEIAINSKNLSITYNGLKIVHFTDLHYPRLINDKKMNNLVKEINLINPDIVVFTGDLFDKDFILEDKDINFLIKYLKQINATYGKYAVSGNHDYEKGMDNLKKIYDEANFKLLDNNYDIIYNKDNVPLFIGGISTITYNMQDLTKTMNYFTEDKDIDYKIILVHEPDYADTIIKEYPSVNLILSGHSHNGQVNIPLIKNIFLPSYSKKYYDNHYTVNNTELYVSSGVGLSVANFRLFNKPSINFYRIRKTEK